MAYLSSRSEIRLHFDTDRVQVERVLGRRMLAYDCEGQLGLRIRQMLTCELGILKMQNSKIPTRGPITTVRDRRFRQSFARSIPDLFE